MTSNRTPYHCWTRQRQRAVAARGAGGRGLAAWYDLRVNRCRARPLPGRGVRGRHANVPLDEGMGWAPRGAGRARGTGPGGNQGGAGRGIEEQSRGAPRACWRRPLVVGLGPGPVSPAAEAPTLGCVGIGGGYTRLRQRRQKRSFNPTPPERGGSVVLLQSFTLATR